MGLARGYHIIARLIGLKHQPHRFHEILRVTPIALRVNISYVQLVLQAKLDPGGGASHFSGNESFASSFTLVIKQNAVAGKESIRLPVINGYVIGISFRTGIGRAGMKWSQLSLRDLLN